MRPALTAWLLLLAAAAPALEPRIVRGPYLQALLETSVEVLWTTESPGRGALELSEEAGPPRIVPDPAPAASHSVQLEGLTPGTAYGYRVLHDGSPLHVDPFRFRTSPRPGEGEIRISVIGDSGSGDELQLAVAGVVREIRPDIFLHTGDLDYMGDVDLTVFGPYREILAGACLFPARGNHDLSLDWTSLFHAPPGGPADLPAVYSFDWGSAHFAAADTNAVALAGGAQLAWLEADLAAAREAGRHWIILYMHEPIYTVGSYSVLELAAREVIPAIADRHRVDLVLSGHDHNYQRSHPVRGDVVRDAWQDPELASPAGTIYVVTGGGGGILYSEILRSDHRFSRVFLYMHHALELVIGPTRIEGRALAPLRGVVDRFAITKGPRPELRFLRGDVDSNGGIDVADPIRILFHLFIGPSLQCPAAADADASGLPLDIGDPIYLLNHLFLGGPPPEPPFPECGKADGADDAFCTRAGCAG
ncbi:MAG: metallophosphoesterase family protein [Planctomycetes bacterium]|nr:metallophosphoesterase family protein [Planctomycetota bacterium]